MEDKSQDYRSMLGFNLLPGMEGAIDKEVQADINPFDGPPKNDKEYRQYRSYYEGVMARARAMQGMTTDEGFMSFSAACEWKDAKLNPIHGRGKQKPEHKGCAYIYACHHVIHSDPVNPEAVRYIPFSRGVDEDGYYLCATCFKLLEKCKLNIWYAVGIKCGLCAGESISARMEKDPGLFIDMRLIS